jgi:hypothetical protein
VEVRPVFCGGRGVNIVWRIWVWWWRGRGVGFWNVWFWGVLDKGVRGPGLGLELAGLGWLLVVVLVLLGLEEVVVPGLVREREDVHDVEDLVVEAEARFLTRAPPRMECSVMMAYCIFWFG